MDGLKGINLKVGDLLGSLKKGNLKELQGEIAKGEGNKTLEQKTKAATDFEALLLGQMFKEMWKNVDEGKEGLVTSDQEPMYRDMLNEQLAKEIAEKQSIGIKDIILKDFK